MGLYEDILTGSIRSLSPVEEQQVEKKEDPSVLKDLAMAVPRGLEGMVQGVYNLADSLTGDDLLPDYDTRKFGRSQTAVGGFAEGTVQFLSAFIPIAGQIGRVGKMAAYSKSLGSAAGKLAKGQKHLKYNEWAKVNKLKTKKYDALGGVVGGMGADFVAFNGVEERLSNLIQSVPALKNPVTEYLQSDPNDSELEGRFKNVIEGLFIEAGMRGLGGAFFRGLKTVKARKTNIDNGMDEFAAREDALSKSELTNDDLTYSPVDERIKDRAEEDALIDEMGGDYGTPDFRDKDTDGARPDGSTFDESADVSADTPVDESGVVKPPEERDLPEMPEDSAKPLDPNDDPNPYVDPDADEPIGGRIGGKEVDEIPSGARDEGTPDTGFSTPEDTPEVNFVNEIKTQIKKVFKKYGDEASGQGGRRALRSVYRTLGNDKERAAFARALADERMANIKPDEITKEELIKSNEELMLSIGGDDDAFQRQLLKAGDDVEKLKEIRADQIALYEMLDMASENVHSAARRYLDALEGVQGINPDFARTQVYHALEQLEAAQRIWSQMGREYSLGLLSRKFLYNQVKNVGDGIDLKSKPSKATMQSYIDKKRGSVSEKKMMNLILSATGSEDYLPNGQVMKALTQLTAGGRLRLGFDMLREYWVNALLSGPATQVVNLLGNSITQGIRMGEMAVGAALTGNRDLLRATLDMSLLFESFQEGLTAMTKAFKTGDLVTIKGNKVFDDTNFEQGAITRKKAAKMLGVDENNIMAGTFGFIGNVARMPSRFLLTGDEFYKTMNYRHYMRVELATKGYEQGLRGDDLGKYIHKNMEATLTKRNQMYSEDALYMDAMQEANEKGLTFRERRQYIAQYMQDNKRSMEGITDTEMKAMIERSKQSTLINTHTADAKFGSIPELGKIINDNPWLSFVVPFLRTPANILKFGVERTGLAAFKAPKDLKRLHELNVEKINNQLHMANHKERAEIIGRLSTATAMSSLGLWYVMSNKDIISGYGPRDREEREMWKNAGNQEYSIRIGDKNYSYQRLDPLATMLGIYADIVHGLDSEELDGGTAEQLFAMLAMTMQNNITNKSYVQGLDGLFQLIRDPIKNAPKFGGNIVGGLVPNIINQSMNYQEDRELKETRKFLDYALKRTPQGAEMLDPKRDLFGGKMTMPTSGIKGVLSPIYEKPISSDIVDHEFANLGHGFSKPSHMLGGKIDMREFKSGEGNQSAYDRMLELSGTIKLANGLTMKEALREMIKSDAYQALPVEGDEFSGEKSPRVKLLGRLMRAYRVRARAMVLDEFQELRGAYSQQTQAKYNYLNARDTDG